MKSKSKAGGKSAKKCKSTSLSGVKTSLSKKQAVWLMMMVGSTGYYYKIRLQKLCKIATVNTKLNNYNYKDETILFTFDYLFSFSNI